METGEERSLHPTVALARKAVEAFIRDDRVIDPCPLPSDLPARAGVFVTIRRFGSLRGCVGTIEPATPSLADEIIRSALLAATEDPRFPPVRADELDELTYSVSILEPAEPVESLAELDPARFGVIVQWRHRRGLLLPGIAGIEDPAAQVDAARRKAGIPDGVPLQVFRFRTLYYE